MRAVEGASPYKNAFDAIRTVGDAALGVPAAHTRKLPAPRRIRTEPQSCHFHASVNTGAAIRIFERAANNIFDLTIIGSD